MIWLIAYVVSYIIALGFLISLLDKPDILGYPGYKFCLCIGLIGAILGPVGIFAATMTGFEVDGKFVGWRILPTKFNNVVN